MFSIIRLVNRACVSSVKRHFYNDYPKNQSIILYKPRPISLNKNILGTFERTFVISSETPAGFHVYDKCWNKIALNRVDCELIIHKTYNKMDYFKRHIDSEAVKCDTYLRNLAIVAAIAHWNLQNCKISGLDITTDLFIEYNIHYNDKKLLTYFGINKIHVID